MEAHTRCRFRFGLQTTEVDRVKRDFHETCAQVLHHVQDMQRGAEPPGELPAVSERHIGRLAEVSRDEDVVEGNHVSPRTVGRQKQGRVRLRRVR